ncbi:hypothetical protein HAP47_0002970 [Bradyrhizobium sp. 41S5]|uniref:hypothetical protein n=1 Tax=Bradyrhizobium sp. 41S5 TaxID=1404443 RepID=UPI00156B67B3|nr:hypothetical protein [Bradyrhizobium sp. 41S5]UFX45701.1 hypothetical protein HAP47_0002970 [Bradyrhizobium sp. 41S5]
MRTSPPFCPQISYLETETGRKLGRYRESFELNVQGIAAPQTFIAEFERDTEGRLCLKGRLRQDAAGPWWFRAVTGATPDGRRALIIWRKLTGNLEHDNLLLDTWFTRVGYSAKDS